jgi:hypothetical protein
MANPGNTKELEAQLLAELGEIERRIANLSAERDSLQRVLLRVHNQKLGGQKGARRNSYDRLLIENRILEAFRAAKGNPLSTRQLFREARAASPMLKDVTFRSHLHRLKERAFVVPQESRRGYWRLPGAPNDASRAIAEKPPLSA